jgi:hypothetical protein
MLRPLRTGFRTVVKYRKIPPAAAANQITENARIPPAADLQKNKSKLSLLSWQIFMLQVYLLCYSTTTTNFVWKRFGCLTATIATVQPGRYKTQVTCVL